MSRPSTMTRRQYDRTSSPSTSINGNGGGGGGGGGGSGSSSSSGSPGSSSPPSIHRPLPMSTNHWVEETAGPFTSSSFPSAPRRQPPTLNDISFSDYDGCATFRQPDSTTRALASLQQSKYEKTERRRAAGLLALLLVMAVGMHISSNGYFQGGDGDGRGSGGGGGFRGIPLLKGGGKDLDEGVDEEYESGGGGENMFDEDGGVATADEQNQENDNDEFFYPLAPLADFSSTREESDIPFFWHVPRSAGSTMKDIMGQCLGLTAASEVGVRDGHQYDESLQLVEYKGNKYVNVDTTTLPGIERAKELNLGSSGVTDVVISSYVFEPAEIFDDSHRGRAFTMLRDPIERAVSMYQFVKRENPALADLSLADFARGSGIENNWMVRYLVNQLEGELDRDALENAKEVLRRKFIVGLIGEKEESVKRFRKYFEWTNEDEMVRETQSDCTNMLLSNGVNISPEPYDLPQRGSQEWALISHQTQYDIKLYDYAKELFEEQTKQWGSTEYKKEQKRKKKAGGK